MLGGTLRTNGTLTGIQISDPGLALDPGPPPVPALSSPAASALLGLLLCLAGAAALLRHR